MANLTMYFPGGLYPQDYSPAIQGFNYNPFFTELVSFDGEKLIGKPTDKLVVFQLANGLKAKIIGKDFKFNADGVPKAGTITSFQLLQSDGKTLVQSLTGFSLAATKYYSITEKNGIGGLAEFVLSGADKIVGTKGDDDLIGYAGDDTLIGGAGSDYLEGDRGKDTYDGGDGFDILSFVDAHWTKGANTGIDIDLQKGTVTDPYGNKETFKNIEAVRGTQFKDVMKGSTADNEFMGLRGADTFDGRGGIDSVTYHRDDRFGGTKGVTVDLGKGYAIDGFGDRDTLISIEGARGTVYNDTLTGSAANNWLSGRAGNDTLSGLDGDDVFYGGPGKDLLTGGKGKDTFAFDTDPNLANNVDTITDFNVTDDTIQLSRSYFTALIGKTTISSAEFVKNTSGKAVDGNDHIIYETDTGKLFYDSNGFASGGSVHFATLAKNLNLTINDFVII